MNNTGNKKSGYLVALLLVVGLAAFSNSMKELAEIHRFTLDSSGLIAQYMVPAEVPQIPQIPQVVVAKLDSCDSEQAVPSVVELTVPAPPVKVERVAPRVRGKINRPTAIQLAKVEKFRQFEFHATPFEFRKPNNVFRLSTRDREMILKTLNRSINLRTAS